MDDNKQAAATSKNVDESHKQNAEGRGTPHLSKV